MIFILCIYVPIIILITRDCLEWNEFDDDNNDQKHFRGNETVRTHVRAI